jgi:hypothetical protein
MSNWSSGGSGDRSRGWNDGWNDQRSTNYSRSRGHWGDNGFWVESGPAAEPQDEPESRDAWQRRSWWRERIDPDDASELSELSAFAASKAHSLASTGAPGWSRVHAKLPPPTLPHLAKRPPPPLPLLAKRPPPEPRWLGAWRGGPPPRPPAVASFHGTTAVANPPLPYTAIVVRSTAWKSPQSRRIQRNTSRNGPRRCRPNSRKHGQASPPAGPRRRGMDWSKMNYQFKLSPIHHCKYSMESPQSRRILGHTISSIFSISR